MRTERYHYKVSAKWGCFNIVSGQILTSWPRICKCSKWTLHYFPNKCSRNTNNLKFTFETDRFIAVNCCFVLDRFFVITHFRFENLNNFISKNNIVFSPIAPLKDANNYKRTTIKVDRKQLQNTKKLYILSFVWTHFNCAFNYNSVVSCWIGTNSKAQIQNFGSYIKAI